MSAARINLQIVSVYQNKIQKGMMNMEMLILGGGLLVVIVAVIVAVVSSVVSAVAANEDIED